MAAGQKPLLETVPYVPPLANTFTQNSTVLAPEPSIMGQSQPVMKLSDADIIAGVSNVNPNEGQQTPLINLSATEPPAVQQVIAPGQPAPHQLPPQPIQAAVPAHQNVYGSIPPTSVASLNESFGISTSGGAPNQYYQPTVSNGQGKVYLMRLVINRTHFSTISFH